MGIERADIRFAHGGQIGKEWFGDVFARMDELEKENSRLQRKVNAFEVLMAGDAVVVNLDETGGARGLSEQDLIEEIEHDDGMVERGKVLLRHARRLAGFGKAKEESMKRGGTVHSLISFFHYLQPCGDSDGMTATGLWWAYAWFCWKENWPAAELSELTAMLMYSGYLLQQNDKGFICAVCLREDDEDELFVDRSADIFVAMLAGTELDEGHHAISEPDLYCMYLAFCQENGLDALDRKDMLKALDDRGLQHDTMRKRSGLWSVPDESRRLWMVKVKCDGLL